MSNFSNNVGGCAPLKIQLVDPIEELLTGRAVPRIRSEGIHKAVGIEKDCGP